MCNRPSCMFADLGLLDIPLAETRMIAASELVGAGDLPGLLFVLAHPPSIAVGLKDRLTCVPKDLLVSPDRLAEEGIALVRSIRGGGITYHWPGQIVCYPVLRLGAKERNVSAYMTKLEDVGITTLKTLGLEAMRRRDSAAHIGLWVQGSKIVSMGIRVSKWVTSFGFALNLNGDFAASRYIRPCGLEGVCLTSVEELLGEAPPRDRVIDLVKKSFACIFERRLIPARPDLVSLLEGATREPVTESRCFATRA